MSKFCSPGLVGNMVCVSPLYRFILDHKFSILGFKNYNDKYLYSYFEMFRLDI